MGPDDPGVQREDRGDGDVVSTLLSTVVCAGCGTAASADDPFPFRCPNARAGDDIDHVLTVVLDPSRVRFPVGVESNPFIRYRPLLHSHHFATARGMSDAAYVGAVAELNSAIARVDGREFVPTPFAPSAPLSDHFRFETGHVWVKDEAVP